MFGSPITRVLFSVTAIAFFQDLFIWPHKFRTRLLYYSYILVMCSVLSLEPVQASEMGSFEKIFDSFTCYLLPQGVTCYMLSGFRSSALISIRIIIQLSLLLSFTKYIRSRQYCESPFILRD